MATATHHNRRTKTSAALTLHDRLSRLTLEQAEKLLGPYGRMLMVAGGKIPVDTQAQVRLTKDALRLTLGEPGERRAPRVKISLDDGVRQRLRWECSACEVACEHVAAAFSVVLEEKTNLGLAVEPLVDGPPELLSEEQLVARAYAERLARAREERMHVKALSPDGPWSDYLVTSKNSGKSYRVALRGTEPGESFCSCPDFRTNTLGTCKHVLHVLEKARRRFTAAQLARRFRPAEPAVYLKYGAELELRVLLPATLEPEVAAALEPWRDRPLTDAGALVKRLARLERAGRTIVVYPDAEEYIGGCLFRQRMAEHIAAIRADVQRHPLRKELLKTELLPYQLDGIAFAAGTGRAILADEMGLGKTIQGVGVAELLAREAGIRKVLVVCPASLKAQWRSEILRFCGRDCQLVAGSAEVRAEQYGNECFFTICNYEQVVRDLTPIERVPWDLIVLDEAQRIKNWEAKTTRIIKGLRSPFALALSGTPLENRLDELFSVVQFIDDRRLAPAFRFFHRHRVVDEKGKVLGYKNLAELREQLRPVMLRRTRESVRQQLPPRTNEIVRIPPTGEQLELHRAQMQVVSTITRKKFLTEMDLLRLQKALLLARMAADSTVLVDKERPGYSTKLERLDELFEQLFAESDRKVLLFSEWTTMLDLIEPLLERRGLHFVRLDGSVPQKQRPALVSEFQNEPGCKLFLTTNAGSTGLNLQAANTVINVDLPWNPAVLEQRIARAYRMGQTQSVQVYILVTEETIEENLLATLSAKHELALAALDVDSEVDQVDLSSGMEELKRRLEVLLGSKAHAAVDESQQRALGDEAERLARQERMAAAGGQLVSAAFAFLGSLAPAATPTPETQSLSSELEARLRECVTPDGQGRPQLTVTLPDAAALAQLAQSLAGLLSLRAA